MANVPQILSPNKHLARVRLVCCDVDGVMTDGGLYYDDTGGRMVRFHVHDGMGLKRLQNAGIEIAFISQSTNSYIKRRADDLGVGHCYVGVEDKSQILKEIVSILHITFNEVAHIADDVNDLSLLCMVGVPITVPQSAKEVQDACLYITQTNAGQGAVRELCDAILKSKEKYRRDT